MRLIAVRLTQRFIKMPIGIWRRWFWHGYVEHAQSRPADENKQRFIGFYPTCQVVETFTNERFARQTGKKVRNVVWQIHSIPSSEIVFTRARSLSASMAGYRIRFDSTDENNSQSFAFSTNPSASMRATSISSR